jgi:predicted small lipoprotein YifL
VKRLTFFFFAFAFLSLLSACGQSGALYLPGDPSAMAVPTSPETVSEPEPDPEPDNAADSGESPEATKDD